MEILLDPEELIICPYNNSHHIRRKRMCFHLVKCKKNYSEAKLVTCDFNVNHKVPAPEIQYHHEHCPNRKDVEITIFRENAGSSKYPIHNISVETDESWDDYNVGTYNPTDYCERTDVLRKLDVESAAKRKNFHLMERHRLMQIPAVDRKNKCDEGKDTQINQPTKFRRHLFLPKTPKNEITKEDTPESITELMNRVRLGANTPYNTTKTS